MSAESATWLRNVVVPVNETSRPLTSATTSAFWPTERKDASRSGISTATLTTLVSTISATVVRGITVMYSPTSTGTSLSTPVMGATMSPHQADMCLLQLRLLTARCVAAASTSRLVEAPFSNNPLIRSNSVWLFLAWASAI